MSEARIGVAAGGSFKAQTCVYASGELYVLARYSRKRSACDLVVPQSCTEFCAGN